MSWPAARLWPPSSAAVVRVERELGVGGPDELDLGVDVAAHDGLGGGQQAVHLGRLGLEPGDEDGPFEGEAEPLGEGEQCVAVELVDVAVLQVVVGMEEADDPALGDDRGARRS